MTRRMTLAFNLAVALIAAAWTAYRLVSFVRR
jgi:hypothetical protein